MEPTDDQIRYGFDHLKNADPEQRRAIELAEWRGETETKLTINCT